MEGEGANGIDVETGKGSYGENCGPCERGIVAPRVTLIRGWRGEEKS